MNAHSLLRAASQLVESATGGTAGLWARAAAMLTRQALETELEQVLSTEAPGSQAAPFHTRFLVLRVLHEHDDLAARVAYTWVALSQATHHQGYELPPTADALRGWIETVNEFVARRRQR